MQIVLLSGGGGKRLWPLSDEVRSKQFLQVLQSPSGQPESMIQRVVRQLRAVLPQARVTVATGEAQEDLIRRQLGGDVSVVTEPARRDTFPAIALAASYLASEGGCAPDEVAVVMPCDVYTDETYFRALERMAAEVENGTAELVLMGICPDGPSSKFGYIVPEGAVDGARGGAAGAGGSTPEDALRVLPVQRFEEKPAEERARQLLAEGALWNGGVFAFRLSYVLEALRGALEAAGNESPTLSGGVGPDLSFPAVRSRYESLPRISFDYAVVEKAASVAVLPFDGPWKDLGTWNTLCGELPAPVQGRVVLGPNSADVNVLNTLDMPVVVEGVQDVVVVVSPAGVLVCRREDSENIKSLVQNL